MTVAPARPQTSDRRVLVRGAESPLGWAILGAIGDLEGIEVCVADDANRHTPHAVDTVVEVGLADHDFVGQRGESPAVSAAELLDAVKAAGAHHVVLVTSAMVYGAISSNPVPLTEEAVLRPDPTFVYARQLAAAEELVEAWRRAQPDRTVTVLRPVTPVDEHGTSSLARALTSGLGQRFGESDPGGQFVHHVDVASAVSLAVARSLDGVYNVAPDGSIPGDRLRALTGRAFGLPLPDRVSEVLSSLRWRFQRGPIPPGLRAYIREPWIVANDKLRAAGWQPTITNEQAFVEGTEAKWWTMITPKRRQELALGALAVALVAAAVASGVMARRWWRLRTRR